MLLIIILLTSEILISNSGAVNLIKVVLFYASALKAAFYYRTVAINRISRPLLIIRRITLYDSRVPYHLLPNGNYIPEVIKILGGFTFRGENIRLRKKKYIIFIIMLV